MSTNLTAKSLVETLRGHYLPEGRPPGGLFAAEIGSPDGRRRADALWLPMTRAGGEGLVGHEIKVSRSDVIVELADPTKAEPWSQYCSQWWLVVSDPALVEGLEIPEAWGIMSPPSGRRTRSMTIIRKAPKLTPIDPAPGLRRLLTWYMHRTSERMVDLEGILRGEKYSRARAEQQLAEARAGGGSDSPHAKRIARILFLINQQARRSGIWSEDDELIAAAVVDALAVRSATESARGVLADLDKRLAEPLSYARTHIQKILKEVS